MRYLILLLLFTTACSSPLAPSVDVTPKPRVTFEVLVYTYASGAPLKNAIAAVNGKRYSLPATIEVEVGFVDVEVFSPFHHSSKASGTILHSGERWTFWLVPTDH
jgi:hypothetical protein